MSLYLTIFDGDEEVVGWVFGHYSDFGCFRDTIAAKLRSADYPTLMTHSDCDGDWPVANLPTLRRELEAIATAFRRLRPEAPKQAFEHTAEYRRGARSLYVASTTSMARISLKRLSHFATRVSDSNNRLSSNDRNG
jgi:hypothetical protein